MATILQNGAMIVTESISAVTATPSQRLGERRIHAGEEYVYVYNAGGATIATTTAQAVKFVTAATNYSVANTALTDVFNPFVGVVKHAAIAAGSYGWAMTKGHCSVTVVSALTADYIALACGASGTFIEASGTSTLGTACKVGYARNANTAALGTLTNVFITGA